MVDILGDLKDLRKEQVLYAIVIPLSLIIPGATYILVFNDKIPLPSTVKLDFLTFIFLSAVFSLPFFFLASLFAAKYVEKDILVYVHQNYERIKKEREEDRGDLIKKLVYEWSALNNPVYTIYLFYLTLVSFYTTSVSSPFIIPRIITYFDLAKNEQTVFWSWAVAWTIIFLIQKNVEISHLKKENPGYWKEMEVEIDKWRARHTIQFLTKKSKPQSRT